jgi:hypothetical protein
MKPTATTITVPTWAKPAKADRYTLFEAAALLGFQDQWVRMTAADQRALMGFAVFGKRAFKVNDDGTVNVMRSTCFGMDFEQAEYFPGEVTSAASRSKQLSPGTFGPAFA